MNRFWASVVMNWIALIGGAVCMSLYADWKLGMATMFFVYFLKDPE